MTYRFTGRKGGGSLLDFGYQIETITQQGFKTIRCPTYPEVT